ncbi:MAG: hypothetical protein U9Q67_04720 [Patescibacteria group bacterium]|nr:hypothetical protein [Patescibacteria group bacterium]
MPNKLITDRQREVLLAVIMQFMQEGVPVGSGSVASECDIGVSSATIRNEMVQLALSGFLSKSHSSAGRIPTDLGFRFFVKELMDEASVTEVDEVNTRQSLFSERFDEESVVREALKYLSHESKSTAVSLLGNVLRYQGASNLLRYSELRDLDTIEGILDLLENKQLISKIFSRGAGDKVCIAIGEESEVGCLSKCSFVFSRLNYLGNKKGYISILGPRRMDYSRVIPAVRFIRDVVEESVRGW